MTLAYHRFKAEKPVVWEDLGLEALVADATSKGARVLCGGKASGPCFAPTVLYGVAPKMRVYAEESFGPLVSIVVAENSEDAVQNANDTEYGLSSAIFSRDVNKAMKMAERLETGMCHINGSTVHDEPQMPFGGMKHSGWGRFGGHRGPGRVHWIALDHHHAVRDRIPHLMFVDVETRCGKQLADQTGTGLRMGELTGLECKHFDGESVKVEQAVNGAVGKPKRKNAYRVQAA